MPHSRQYKPLEISKTLRNPKRVKDFLRVVKENVNEFELSSDTIYIILKTLIKEGIYKPNLNNPFIALPTPSFADDIKLKWELDQELLDEEVETIMDCMDPKLSSTPRKYAGFDYGWCSRFYTQYEELRNLGFVKFTFQLDIPGDQNKNYRDNSVPIEITPLGDLMLDEENPFGMQLSFLNGIANYQRNSIVEKVLNKNKPFILLLKVLKKFHDIDENSPGISRNELAIFSIWKDDDAESLFNKIIEFRNLHGRRPSDETVFDYCGSLLNINSEHGGWDRRRNMRSVVKDNTDVIIRYMLITGLIEPRGVSLDEGLARYICLNKNLIKLTDYLINEKSDLIENYENYSIHDFISSIQNIDSTIPSFFDADYVVSTECTNEHLDYWLNHFGIETIIDELNILNTRSRTNNEDLIPIADYIRFEFLAALFLHHKHINNNDVTIKANYLVLGNGFPYHQAPRGKPDIEFTSSDINKIVELTLTTTQQQNLLEVSPITRRKIPSFQEIHPDGFADLISPSFHTESVGYAEYQRDRHNIVCNLITIEEFVSTNQQLS